MPVSRPKLLLADDSITIQKVVNLTFADHGMDVYTFADGDSAVEHLDEIKPDIVLADVNMPGINGYQLCELMRSDDANRTIPVVLLVGSFEPFDGDEAQRVGANSHLTKPFASIADLISTVDKLLAETAASTKAEPSVPPPDTSDIDHLYEQSFVETVELPPGGVAMGGFDNDGLDDEMIQTSYAEPDLNSDVEDTYFAADSDEMTHGMDELETESLIAESMPQMVDEAREDEQPPHPLELESAPAAEVSGQGDTVSETTYEFASDPFESVAGEAPAVSVEEDISSIDTARFLYDDSNLLELPGTAAAAEVDYPEQTAVVQTKEITSLSPELIDLIVDKVIERLEKRQYDRAAQGGG